MQRFREILLAQLATQDRRYAHPEPTDRSTWDPYCPETRQKIREVVLAATDVDKLIDDLVQQFYFWSREELKHFVRGLA